MCTQQNVKVKTYAKQMHECNPFYALYTHNVQVGEDVSLRVLLVNLVDIGTDYHQQLQMSDLLPKK